MQIKCRINDDSCSRCKHLGKTCTFSSIKHRGDQRIRKASSNNAQHESSLDLSIQSSASSSSKDTGHEKGVCSATRSLAASLLADGDVDDSGRGQQQLLAEPISDRVADILPNFDQSPLAESGQPTSDQDGGDVFNLTFSPFPFSSTLFPSTYPEQFQPAATRTSEDLLSASSSSRDKIPPCLPPASFDYTISIHDTPTRQSQNWSLFEIGSNATPTSIPESTSVSTAFSSQSPRPSRQSCQCLAAVVFAVEELEATANAGVRAELDSIVAQQKEAIKCSSCAAKRENLVLLVFVSEKLVPACGRIVGLYGMRDGDGGSVPSSSPERSPFYRANVEDRDLATCASSSSSKTECTHSGTSSDWRELLLGDYEVSSSLEWEHLVGVLIRLQLRAVMGLLAEIKSMGSKVLGETQMASLAQAEITVGELEKGV